MTGQYQDLDPDTRDALKLGREDLRERLSGRADFFAKNDDMIADLAARILDEFRAALAAGRDRALMIVPVGPVGQYDLLAKRCRTEGISLDRLTLIIMDEYLTDEGDWISDRNPLSFRGHIQRHLLDALPAELRPEVIVPHPGDTMAVGNRIAELGGIDVTFGGVGITGHLAFNDPMPGVTDPEYFADLPTRVVPLLPETRLINSVTAARGNVAAIPRLAVTVGMREILSARKLRIYMNRHWQSAAIRRLAFGPRRADFPASLVQGHPDWHLYVVENVLDPAEPELA